MLGGDAGEGGGAARVDAREVAGIVVRVEAALVVAANVEALDDAAVLAQRLRVGVRDHAVDGDQQLAGDARGVERRLVDGAQAVGRLAEVDVLACSDQFVIAFDGGLERGGLVGVELHRFRQLVERVALLQRAALDARLQPERVEVLLRDGLAVVHVGVERGARRRGEQARAAAGVEPLDVFPVAAVPNDPREVAGLVRAAGVAHGVALVLIHEALAVRVHMEERLAAGQEDVAALVGAVELGIVEHDAAVPDHAGAARFQLGSRPQRHADAVALLGDAVAQHAPVGVAGAQVLQHLVVRAVAARAHDDAVLRVDLDDALVLRLRDDAAHLARLVLHEHLRGRHEHDFAAQLAQHLVHHFKVGVRAVVRAVGVVLAHAGVIAHGRVVGVRVVGLVPFEREQHALGLKRLLHPFDHLARLLGPGFVQQHVGIARLGLVRMVQQGGDVFDMVGLQRGVERADSLACGGDVAALFQHDDLRAVLRGRGGGHEPAVAGAYHHEVGFQRLGDVGGHIRLVAPTTLRVGVGLAALSAFGLRLRRASGQRPGCGQRARRGDSRQEVPAADGSFSHDSLLVCSVSTRCMLRGSRSRVIARIGVYSPVSRQNNEDTRKRGRAAERGLRGRAARGAMREVLS